MKTRARSFAVIFAGVLAISACSSTVDSTDKRIAELEAQVEELQSGSSAETSTLPSTTAKVPVASSPSTTRPDILPPEIDVEWFESDDDFTLFRFLAWITNPNDVPLSNVVVHWEAIDESGAIVGSLEHRFPSIDAGFRFPYAGGAGGVNLSGFPERVELFVDSPGQADPGAPSPFFTVVESDIGGPDADFGDYEPTAVARSFSDRSASGSRIDVVWVFRNSSGIVVGADFGTDGIVPATVSPDSLVKFRTTISPYTGITVVRPTDVQAFVYEDVP